MHNIPRHSAVRLSTAFLCLGLHMITVVTGPFFSRRTTSSPPISLRRTRRPLWPAFCLSFANPSQFFQTHLAHLSQASSPLLSVLIGEPATCLAEATSALEAELAGVGTGKLLRPPSTASSTSGEREIEERKVCSLLLLTTR